MSDGNRVVIIDFTNYEDYPIGGYLTFAKNLMGSFGTDLALVGITTNDKDPVGKWFRKNINGIAFDFFAMAKYDKSKTRHLVPDRMVIYLLLKYYQHRIDTINIKNIFLQRQELMIAIRPKTANICYCFAGLENPLTISKYPFARNFSKLFERLLFKKLKHTQTILARGDDSSIDEMIKRSNGLLIRNSVIKFPTRINTRIFRIRDKLEARQKLGFSSASTIIITTGRLAHYKGWKFLIDCFVLFEKKVPGSKLHFVGDGEDYEKIKVYISNNKLIAKIALEGRRNQDEVAMYLNASDLFIMGSYIEGWSTSLIEALACGIPVCVTDFGSAKEVVEEGKNGFVVNSHDTDLFTQAMLKALMIPRPIENGSIMRYASEGLRSDLLKYWKLS
jgi:glycosyltransferase involved in cell wall biosynthesis